MSRLIDADLLGLTDMEIIMCDGDYKEALKMLIDKIEHAPTIEERKKGKWIAVDDYFNRISGRCSACGWEAHMYEDDVVGMNYCPNCGADMRGEENESDRR